MKIKVLYIIFITLLLNACQDIKVVIDSPEKADFMLSDAVGYYKNGVAVLLYDEETMQTSFNKKRFAYRLQTDDQSRYFFVDFETAPRSVGVHILTEFKFFNGSKMVESTIFLECSQIEENKYWFWDKESKTGILIEAN